MINLQQAAFSFNDFKVPQFSFNASNDDKSEIILGLSPSGEYHVKKGIFIVRLEFISHNKTSPDRLIFELKSVSKFEFQPAPPDLESIPPFFYKNAIAIIFPYLRAFISTLTLQSNSKVLKLGLMNLSDLEEPFKESTVMV
jgi:preprotein translocase subunit SecB